MARYERLATTQKPPHGAANGTLPDSPHVSPRRHGRSAGDARNPLRIMELEVVARNGHLTQEGPAPCRAFETVSADGSVHQVTVTTFEQVLVPDSHTLYVALVTVLGGLSVYAPSLGVVATTAAPL